MGTKADKEGIVFPILPPLSEYNTIISLEHVWF